MNIKIAHGSIRQEFFLLLVLDGHDIFDVIVSIEAFSLQRGNIPYATCTLFLYDRQRSVVLRTTYACEPNRTIEHLARNHDRIDSQIRHIFWFLFQNITSIV